MEKYKVFEKELSNIKNPEIKDFTIKALNKLPDYFYVVPASSTGKYHSKFCLGDQGLIRHTKVFVRIAVDLMNLEMMTYNDLEKDVVISSALLHDGMKHGATHSKYSIAEHPLIVADFIQNDSELNKIIEKETLDLILGCIRSHMGEFNTDYKTKKEILPKPKTKLQNFVHLCDYLASRKYFEEFNFDVDIIRK